MLFFKKKPKPEAGAEGEAEVAAPELDADGNPIAPAKKKPPILLIAIAGVVLLGGLGAGGFFLFGPKPAAEAGKAGDKAHAKPKKKEKKGGEGGEGGKGDKSAGGGVVREGPDGVTFYTLPDLVVNIQSAEGKPTFLKLKLTLETRDDSVVERLDAEGPRLQDMFQSFLRELRPEDISGSQGSFQLRMEILRRVNLILAPGKVDAVLIEEMLIQ
jgi:flagellar FliL protein